jgi:hypothetical protein
MYVYGLGSEDTVWNELGQDRLQCGVLVNTAMNIKVPEN